MPMNMSAPGYPRSYGHIEDDFTVTNVTGVAVETKLAEAIVPAGAVADYINVFAEVQSNLAESTNCTSRLYVGNNANYALNTAITHTETGVSANAGAGTSICHNHIISKVIATDFAGSFGSDVYVTITVTPSAASGSIFNRGLMVLGY